MKREKRKSFIKCSTKRMKFRRHKKNSDVISDKFLDEDAKSNLEFSDNNIDIESGDDIGNLEHKKDKDEYAVHKKSIENLKETDPEFYKYLEDNDEELLKFGQSEDGDSDSLDEDTNFDEKLASNSNHHKNYVTIDMINDWEKNLSATSTVQDTLKTVVQAFQAAVQQTKVENPQINSFMVQDPDVLHIPPNEAEPQLEKYKKWKKIRGVIKDYLKSLSELLSSVSESTLVCTILKHMQQIIPCYIALPKLAKRLIQKLSTLWCSDQETVRVLSFACILKITHHLQASILNFVLKQLYFTYVKNTKFTSPSTWPGINFMRHSLVQLYAVSPVYGYQQAFIYIRQLAIHLRSALIHPKSETIITVCNWQFVHSLHLWIEMLCQCHSNSILQPLIYPITMITLGVIKLLPSARYLPLRYHCIHFLIQLADKTNTHIPVLPVILEQHKTLSQRPLNLHCLLRISTQEQKESSFRDSVVNSIYELLLEYLSVESHRIAFPELVTLVQYQIRLFLKKCHVANYCRKLRQLLEKIEENIKFIERRRTQSPVNLYDDNAVVSWEKECKCAGPPLLKYFLSWMKVKNQDIILSEQPHKTTLKVINIRKKSKDRKKTKKKFALEKCKTNKQAATKSVKRYFQKEEKYDNKSENVELDPPDKITLMHLSDDENLS